MFNVFKSSDRARSNQELRAPSQQVFYHELVDWDHIDALAFRAEPLQQVRVRQLILETLDHVVITTVLERLPMARHEEFLEMCSTQFADPMVMEWLKTHVEDMSDHINQALTRTKAELTALVVVV